MTDFAARLDVLLAEYFALEPVAATAAGNHEHDGRWPDLTAAGRAARLAFVERWSAELAAFPDPELSADERVDRDLLLGELAAMRFAEVELREEAWSPLWWVYQIGGGLFRLVAREFAPLPARVASLAERAEGLLALLGAARVALVGHAGRAVDRLHTDKSLEQWPGLIVSWTTPSPPPSPPRAATKALPRSCRALPMPLLRRLLLGEPPA